MSAADRHAWTEPGVEDLGGGVYRIPLPLPMQGLKAVNVYAITDDQGVDLIDAGIALVQARERLTKGLRQIGYELGDIRNFFVTHIHIDHYSLAVELRETLRNVITLGEGERANIAALHDMARGRSHRIFGGDLHRLGADELAAVLAAARDHRGMPRFTEWAEPDRWLADGTELDLRSRTLRAVHTPGHTRGHVVFHDAAAKLMFSGDHVLPHITPSIGFQEAPSAEPLREYLQSLNVVRRLPDMRLLPAHGPVSPSTHARIDELTEHHAERLRIMADVLSGGERTGYEVALSVAWTSRQRKLGDLDLMNQMLAVCETVYHLDLLAAQGAAISQTDEDGIRRYRLTGR